MTDTPRPEVTVEETDTPPTSPSGRPLLVTLSATTDDETDETVEVHVYLTPGMSPALALLTASRLLTHEQAVELAYQADPVGLARLLEQARGESAEARP